MKNYWNKIRYVIMNLFKIKPAEIDRENCEHLYTDNFHNLKNWVVVHPSAVKPSKDKGAILSISQLNPKNFVSPSIISRTTIEGGSVIIQADICDSDKVMHIFVLRQGKIEMGFKIAGEKIYVVAPYHTSAFKMFHPENRHTFEINICPTDDMIRWYVDNVLVYEIHYPSIGNKHLMISMPSIQGRINPKELPIVSSIKSVKFLVNEAHHLKRTNEE